MTAIRPLQFILHILSENVEDIYFYWKNNFSRKDFVMWGKNQDNMSNFVFIFYWLDEKRLFTPDVSASSIFQDSFWEQRANLDNRVVYQRQHTLMSSSSDKNETSKCHINSIKEITRGHPMTEQIKAGHVSCCRLGDNPFKESWFRPRCHLWAPRLMQLIPRLYLDRMNPGCSSRALVYASTASSLRSPFASVAPRRFHSR